MSCCARAPLSGRSWRNMEFPPPCFRGWLAIALDCPNSPSTRLCPNKIKYIPVIVFSVGSLLAVVFIVISNYKPEALEPFAVLLPGGELTTGRSEIYIWTIEYLRDNPIRMLFGVGFFTFF